MNPESRIADPDRDAEDEPRSSKSNRRRSASEGGGITGWWSNSRTFLTEVRNEMRRVTWPSRKEVYATTVVVILTSAFFGMYLWGSTWR